MAEQKLKQTMEDLRKKGLTLPDKSIKFRRGIFEQVRGRFRKNPEEKRCLRHVARLAYLRDADGDKLLSEREDMNGRDATQDTRSKEATDGHDGKTTLTSPIAPIPPSRKPQRLESETADAIASSRLTVTETSETKAETANAIASSRQPRISASASAPGTVPTKSRKRKRRSRSRSIESTSSYDPADHAKLRTTQIYTKRFRPATTVEYEIICVATTKLVDFINTKLVTIITGPEGSPVSHQVHEDLLAARSEYLRATMNGSYFDMAKYLASPCTGKLEINYTLYLNRPETNRKLTVTYNAFILMASVYVLPERFIDISRPFYPVGALGVIYNGNASASNPLRRLMVDFFCFYLNILPVEVLGREESAELSPRDFLVEVVRANMVSKKDVHSILQERFPESHITEYLEGEEGNVGEE
ncbi:hypothetical protein K458DRAFT_397477 [Lentithecium fluviatile CBS 122367]|uniref:Uncharacterized protein n=1 Tax=Lentithecium fluviatile CBS 122367 TaxID=1168545 RepID=A0A6G1ID35_9PLEO|nr:hypothetical protein K458DRAFT_397477 [Lentithecium fluviatile CBS 122367]